MDPGGVTTNVWKGRYAKPPFSWYIKYFLAPSEDGAEAVLHAATVDFEKEDEAKSSSVRHGQDKKLRVGPNLLPFGHIVYIIRRLHRVLQLHIGVTVRAWCDSKGRQTQKMLCCARALSHDFLRVCRPLPRPPALPNKLVGCKLTIEMVKNLRHCP